MVSWTIENVVAVWMTTPTVNIADQTKIDPLRPKRSEVNAWPRAPLRGHLADYGAKVRVGRTQMSFKQNIISISGDSRNIVLFLPGRKERCDNRLSRAREDEATLAVRSAEPSHEVWHNQTSLVEKKPS